MKKIFLPLAVVIFWISAYPVYADKDDPFAINGQGSNRNTAILRIPSDRLSLQPGVDNVFSLGSSSKRFLSIYTSTLSVSNNLLLSGSAGSNGQVLTSGGAGVVPTWTTLGAGSGDMILASTQTVTGAKTFNSWTTFAGSTTFSNATNKFTGSGLLTVTAPSNSTASGISLGAANNLLFWQDGTNGIVNASGGDLYLRAKDSSKSVRLDTGGVSISSTTVFNGNVNLSSGVLLSGSAGTSGQVFTSGGSGAVGAWTTPSSGGASSLAVTTGSVNGFSVTTSSPTQILNFSSDTFRVSLTGSATAFVLLNPSSVTLLGPSIDISGAEVTGNLPAASIAAGSLGASVIASSVTEATIMVLASTQTSTGAKTFGSYTNFTGSTTFSGSPSINATIQIYTPLLSPADVGTKIDIQTIGGGGASTPTGDIVLQPGTTASGNSNAGKITLWGANGGLTMSSITVQGGNTGGGGGTGGNVNLTGGTGTTDGGAINFTTNGSQRLIVRSTGPVTFLGNVEVSSGVKLSGSAGTSGQVFTSGGSGTVPTWTTPSAGGSSSLAVTTGSITGFVTAISSPTAIINFSSDTFRVSLTGSATAFVLLNPSSVTVLGPNPPAASIASGSLGSSVIASSITLAAMYGAPTLVGTNFTSLPGAQVGSGVPAANIAAGSLGSSVIASSIAVNAVSTGSIVSGAITAAKMANADHGDVSWSGGVATVDNVAAANIAAGSLGSSVIASSIAVNAVSTGSIVSGAITAAKMANADHGDVSWSAGVATVDNVAAANVAAGSLGTSVIASSVAVAKINPAQMNFSGTADGTTFARGDGTWASPAGSGDMVLASTQTVTGAKTFNSWTTHVGSTTFNGNINISSGILLSGSAGTSGQVFTSSGSGLAPVWATASSATIIKVFTPEEAGTLTTSFPQIVRSTFTNIPVSGLAYDASASTESAHWKFRANGYVSGNPTLTIYWYAATASSGDVVWSAHIAAITSDADTQDILTKAYGTYQSVTDTHLGTTNRRLHAAVLTISNLDSLAADDIVWIEIGRNGNGTADTLAGDAVLVYATLSY